MVIPFSDEKTYVQIFRNTSDKEEVEISKETVI